MRFTKALATGGVSSALVAGAIFGNVMASTAHAAGPISGGNPAAADGAAVSYVTTNDPGNGQAHVLKTEPDVEHGVSVYDVRVLAPNGSIYVVHVQQSNDAVLSASLAESQSTTTAPGEASPAGKSSDTTPEQGGASSTPTTSTGAQVSAQAAVQTAVQAVPNQAGLKKDLLKARDGKDVYKVKLRLNPRGTAVVWVDASTATPVVTAIQGHGYHIRDAKLVSATTADTNAVNAVGSGATVLHTQLHRGKWPFYQVKVRTTAGTPETVWVSAATGAVTQMKAS